MKKIEGFENMVKVLSQEKGISKEVLVSAIEAALLSAAKKKFKKEENLRVKIADDGSVEVYEKKIVSDSLDDLGQNILLEDARKINKEANIGNEIEIDITPQDFGRIAAQTAKQVIIQRIREAEKELSFDEFSKRQGEIVSGIVQQREYNGYLVNLGRVETFLPLSEVPIGETYRQKDRIRVYVVEVGKSLRGPFVLISRTHPNLIRKLFELEVPEIADGTLEIINIVREPGRRAKIAIVSKDPNVNVVGTCVGHMGARIQNIVKELGNERIDIIEWKEDPKAYITNALSPAKPSKIDLDKETMTAKVVVPESQLSLAIGREGQNVRLAAKLTGWKIDVQNLSAPVEKVEETLEVNDGKQEKTKSDPSQDQG